MCGIAGIISADITAVSQQRLKLMTDAIVHRGPEAEAFWMKDHTGFGHRRLCIIDLSAAGAQPMHYLNRYTIVYNGELYNYLELKDELQKKGYQFQSRSDTEVLLAAYACYKEKCLQYFDGMFAFAIWDEEEKKLFAARDRFGEKPFFYYKNEKQNEFLFASEIKALWKAGAPKNPDGTMLLNYLSLGWTEHPVEKQKTFYKEICALPPAHFLSYQLGKPLAINPYWTLNSHQKDIDTPFALERFSALFHKSVKLRLRSDVAIGTSLSGGLDSSSVIASANRSSNNHYTHKSFSAVFPGYIKDESTYIHQVATKYNLQSYFTTPGSADLLQELKSFMAYHDEPVSSASVFAQYKVYQLAKENGITVLLDGQGADETLGGYSKYIHWYLQDLWRSSNTAFKKEKAALEKNQILFYWNFRNMISAWLPALTSKLLNRKAFNSIKDNAFIDQDFYNAHVNKESLYKPEVKCLNDLLKFNTCYFGLGELLRYADSNSMAHSCEVRLPFLSHELVEFVFSLPAQLKIHDGWSKWILRKTMEPLLPLPIVWRKDKIGFEPPQQLWMQDPKVIEQVRESKAALVAEKVLNPSVINKKNQLPDAATDDADWRFLIAEALI